MTQQAPAWGRLPLELQARPQWLLAGPNDKGELKVPTTVDLQGRPCLGSSTDRTGFLDYDYACEVAAEFGYGVGYVLTADDPYCCIDIDVKTQATHPDKPELWTTSEQMQRYQSITQHFNSYTEFSRSGLGVHVWVRGKIGLGCQRDGVDVFSQDRFIACTGNVIYDLPIGDRQALLDNMVSQMRAQAPRAGADLLDVAQATDTDEALWLRAREAENSAKFIELCEGDWVRMGFKSQSEADLALMSMFTFYSANDEQCRRMFRQTKLGQRDKANKNDRYLDLTLRLVRGRQAREAATQAVDPMGIANMIAKLEAESLARQQAPAPALPYVAEPGPVAAPTAAPAGPVPTPGLDYPPGCAGAIARFIYDSAPRPVKEVGIVAALGFLAGVAGKAWNIPGSGLNLYIILVARSAVGKEAMHSGLGALVHRLREGVPSAGNYIDFGDFASGPALAKACAANSSFVNVAGEWGRKLKRLAAEGERGGPMQQLRTLMTNLYQKSGPASIVGGINYSNKDNNVASVSGVAYSLIGESTPGTLYDCLNESMMEDGFLSRFTIIEYDGPRPPMNPHQNPIPDNNLAGYLQAMCMQATTQIQNHTRQLVQRDVDAARLLDAFDLECDGHINSTTDESWRQMWNRAHLKVCRISALLAVADNFANPCISLAHASWALDVVRRDIAIMQRRIDSGDIGQGDSSRERKLIAVLKEYLLQAPPTSYGVPAAMQRDAMVPRKYLQIRVCRVSSFTNHKQGATRALDDAIRSLCDSGYLVEVDKAKAGEAYGFQGRCYRIVQLP